MVTNDSINLEFNVINKGSAELSKVSKDITVFKSNIDGAKGSVDGFDKVIQKFSVVTFAQGLLNISTSAAQVVTSMSNLDRAANQVQASLVALHKAEDQIERKQIQLAKAVDQYGSASERAVMISAEIETAYEQLEVKTERHRLAVDQLRDTQILMVSNLVNTVFGGLQTAASLHNMLTGRIKANTLANVENAGVTASASVVRAAGVAPLAGLTGALAANTAGNKINALSQLALGIAVKLNPLMLPLTVASMAIGIGAVAYSMHEMSKVSSDLTSEMGDSSVAVSDLGTSFVGTQTPMSTFNVTMKDGTAAADAFATAMENVKEKHDTLVEAQAKVAKAQDFWSFTSAEDKQKANDQLIIAEKRDKLAKDQEDRAKAHNEKMKIINKELYTVVNGKLQDPLELFKQGKMDVPVIESLEKIGDKVQTLADKFVGLGDTEVGAMKRSLDYHKEEITYLGFKVDQVGQQIKIEEKLEQTKKSNHNNEKNRLREMEQLKKKLSLEYGFTSPGSNRRSFVEGETGYYTGKDSVPFAGVINKKTNEILIASKQRRDFKYVDSILEISKKRIQSGAWSLEEANTYIKYHVSKLNSERNIISSYTDAKTNRMFAYITAPIAKFLSDSRALGKLPEITGMFSGLKVFNPNAKGLTTTSGQFFRDRAAELSAGRLSTPSARNPSTGFTSAGLAAAKGSGGAGKAIGYGGKQSKGRSSKHGGGNRNDGYQRGLAAQRLNQSYISATGYSIGELEAMTGLSLQDYYMPFSTGRSNRIRNLDQIMKAHAERVNLEQASRVRNREELGKRITLLGELSVLGSFDPDVMAGLSASYRTNSATLQATVDREKAQILSQAAHIKEDAKLVTELRGSYYGHDELLDRVRFVDKLAQISTGATVI